MIKLKVQFSGQLRTKAECEAADITFRVSQIQRSDILIALSQLGKLGEILLDKVGKPSSKVLVFLDGGQMKDGEFYGISDGLEVMLLSPMSLA